MKNTQCEETSSTHETHDKKLGGGGGVDLPKSAVTHTQVSRRAVMCGGQEGLFFFFLKGCVCLLQRDGGDLSDFLQEENGHDNGDNVRVCVCSRCT